MKQLYLIAFCLGLASCATVNKTYTPDGKEAYTLNCSGTARGWDTCLKAAGNLCGNKGYVVLDRTSESTVNAQLNSSNFLATKSSERSMLIACKK